MRVIFRTDASIEIGTGHVMRCLTLAEALRESGVACHFITRSHPGHLADRIRERGYGVSLLPAPTGSAPAGPPAHANWAGVSWEQDIDETRALPAGHLVDLLILDHYAFDARWEKRARQFVRSLMVIDDLADRPHDTDLLLDQTFGRVASDYDRLLPAGTTCLVGTKHALLRPEFADMRAAVLAARATRHPQRLLVFMGGVDAADATSAVLLGLKSARLPEDMTLTVVLGSNAPKRANVERLVAEMPIPTVLVINTPDMARLMVEADLAIGAAGTTTWERCCLGLPTIIVATARNQALTAREVISSGAALSPGLPESADFAVQLRQAIEKALSPGRIQAMSTAAAGICDGDGTARVLARLITPKPHFRDARIADSRRVWEWRLSGRNFNLNPSAKSFPEHHVWFTGAVENPLCCFRILLIGALPVGYLRLDSIRPRHATVSICLSEDVRGRGLSNVLLEEATRVARDLRLFQLDAVVHPANLPSLRCFVGAGYRRGDDLGEFNTYQLKLESQG